MVVMRVFFKHHICNHHFTNTAGSQVLLDNQNKQMDIKMKQNVSYEVPSSVMKMTDCAAYGTLPN